ncbi:hypothetical protein L596_024180 [Steinernema carpocapsae]|uniref:Tyrosine-protein phosphatase domain-containing protein n=1 Tax=Steinernema carpocapsae TaxID=34508 RepID=A0A4U5MFY7_STECR|nr:hypothetical protein L596_024180 [Steinernema carpocapsae]
MRDGLCQRPPIVSRDRCQVVEKLKALRRKYATTSNGMDEILPGLFLGNLKDSKDVQQLEEKNVEFIVSAHRNLEKLPDSDPERRAKFRILRIEINDNPGENVDQYFSTVSSFVHAARLEGKGVLVHCLMGVSRSAAFVAAYLLSTTHLEYDNVLAFINSKRPMVNPNFGFRMQLYKFCKSSRRDSERERLTQNSSRSIDQFYADCHSIDPRIVSPFRSNLNKQKSKSENDLRRIALLSKESILNKSTPNLSQLRSEHFPNLRIPFALKSPQRNPSKPALPNFRFTPRPLS